MGDLLKKTIRGKHNGLYESYVPMGKNFNPNLLRIIQVEKATNINKLHHRHRQHFTRC